MSDFKLGDLFTLKNHPFQTAATEILIGGDASFTPPIMVICEILNSSGDHNIDDGIKDPNQIRGLFYSHKTHKYEKHWFKVDEIKILANVNPEGKKINTEAVTLEVLKSTVRNSEVILNSVSLEISKNKISQESRGFQNVTLKRNPYLDFVPPVMTVIDSRLHETVKDNYYKSNGKKKRTHSTFELKCKYYNPSLTTYSEEWLPIDCVVDITSYFKLNSVIHLMNKHVVYTLETPVKFEESQFAQVKTILKIKEIVFYHYKYVLLAEDVWTLRTIKIDTEKAYALEVMELDDLLEKRIPNSSKHYALSEKEFTRGNLYEISYLSDNGVSTNRLIHVTDKFPIQVSGEQDYLIVANCILRKGQVRHFKVSNIKSSRKVKKNNKNEFIQKSLRAKIVQNDQLESEVKIAI